MLTRRFLFENIGECGLDNYKEQVNNLKSVLEQLTECPKSELREFHKKTYAFLASFKKKWQQAKRMKTRFLIDNSGWLDATITFPDYRACKSKKNVGRPKLEFNELSERSKRLKTEVLRSEYSTQELCYAAQMSLRQSNNVKASKIVKDITISPASAATKYRQNLKMASSNQSMLSPEEALSMFVEAKLTRKQYNVIRSYDKKRFPSYKIIQQAKKDCYPCKEDITVTDTLVNISLQSLVDHTVSRLIEVQRDVFENINDLSNLNILFKWGFDGSSGHSQYKQKFLCDSNASDASIFISCMVPLQIISGNPGFSDKDKTVIWQNPKSSSTRYCRPIRFQFRHESVELAKEEKQFIESQINALRPTKVNINRQVVTIQHTFIFSMIDGKICNFITNTKSTQKCYICGLTSKDFNSINKALSTVVNEERLSLGISILHSWIRFFECLLHIAYKIPIKQWQARGSEAKKIVDNQKKIIQSNFKSQLGLIIDMPKPGYGSSNDGNTARRFFENAEIAADITGVNIELIKKFKTVLSTMASGFRIDVVAFKNYCLDTANLFVSLYSWYPMPPTIHKVLIHGPLIIEKSILPIGLLSEEALEASNKIFKRSREYHARKCSRIDANTDIIHWLLITSDPMISKNQDFSKKSLNFNSEVLSLLKAPDLTIRTTSFDVEESSDESEKELLSDFE